MMVPLITAGELALLITAMGGALAVCGGGIAWLVNLVRTQQQEQAAAAEKAEQEAVDRGRQLERMERLLEGTHEQVRNSHTVNLRDDVDKAVATAERAAAGTERNEALLLGIVASLERLERTVAEDREDRVRADREMRTELDRVWVSGEREHRNLWQRIGDGLGVARPGEIDVPDEPY